MICIPIVARNTGEALVKIAKANTLADMLELRLDVMDSFRLEEMVRMASKPVIVTYRSKKEGGKGSVDYEMQTRHLLDAIAIVDCLDRHDPVRPVVPGWAGGIHPPVGTIATGELYRRPYDL